LLYGSLREDGLEVLDGCTCPACSTLLISDIR